MEPTALPETPVATNGKPEGKTVEVHNPATGELIGSVPAMSPKQVTDAVDRARAAQPAWEAARLRRARPHPAPRAEVGP